MTRHIYLMRMATLVLSIVSLPTAFAEVFTRSGPISPAFFGWVIQRAHLTTPWPDVPFGTWRIWDSYLKWSDIEPNEGEFKFEAFDRQVALAKEHRKELIYTFGQTPKWASTAPDEKHAWGVGAGAMPKDMNTWTRYVQAIATRYQGKIVGYEIWNEPKYIDASGKCQGAIFFCGTPEQLVRLTETAAQLLRKIDPAAKIATPGFTDGLRGVERLDRYLSAGGDKYVDAISFHFYDFVPEKNWEVSKALRVVMRKHGLDAAPIWDSEHGFLVQNQEGSVESKFKQGPFAKVFSPEQAAQRMFRAHLVAASSGIERVIWYAWDSKQMGAIGTKDSQPTALAKGYAAMQRWLVGAQISCDDTARDGVLSCNLQRGGRNAKIFWVPEDDASRLLPIELTAGLWVSGLFDVGKVGDGKNSVRVTDGLLLVSGDSKPW